MSEIEDLMRKIIEGGGLELDKTLKQVRAMKGKSNAESLIEQLLNVVKDRSLFYRKRRNAIYALGELKGNKAVEALIEILNEGASPINAERSLKELMERGPFEMSSESREISTELPELRATAAAELGLIGDRRALQPLIATLRNDWAWNARSGAAFGLGELGDKSAVPVLEFAEKTDEDKNVRENAQNALKKLHKHK